MSKEYDDALKLSTDHVLGSTSAPCEHKLVTDSGRCLACGATFDSRAREWVSRPSEATDKLKTWDEKFAEEFLTQDRTNEAITDARIDAYEQYAKGSVGACRQDIAELVAEVRRLRAEPRTDYDQLRAENERLRKALSASMGYFDGQCWVCECSGYSRESLQGITHEQGCPLAAQKRSDDAINNTKDK